MVDDTGEGLYRMSVIDHHAGYTHAQGICGTLRMEVIHQAMIVNLLEMPRARKALRKDAPSSKSPSTICAVNSSARSVMRVMFGGQC